MVRGGRVKYLDPMTFLLLISPHLDQELPLSFLAGKMPAYWYNLEKSKRVKPFRCGEFDACIERAESSQGMPLKKREKYARREDAILHALELEREMLKKQEKLGVWAQNCLLKGKLSSSDDPNVSQKLIVDDSAQTLTNDGLCIGKAGQMGAAFRAKRSKCVYLPAESSDSLDYKETLTNVPIDTSTTGSSQRIRETGHDAEEQESTSSEEPDELAISSEMPHLYLREPITCNEAVSKWQLKGKRNNRNLVKRSVVAPDRKGVVFYGADVEGQRSHLNHTRLGPSLHYDRNDYSDVLDDTDQMFRLEDEYLTSRAVAKGQNKTRHGVDWDEWAWEDQPASRGYWDSKGFAPLYSDRYHFHGRKRSMLVDVDLKVQASYRKDSVPFISITSKLDGKSIIGHPIQVEALKDGLSDNLFSAVDDLSNDGIGFDGSSVLPPAWRTARRTANFRVPRPHILSSSGAEIAADFSLDQERNIEYKKLNGGSSSHKANLSRKNGLDSLGPSIDKKSFKKMPKKVSLISSQKTRTLSSLSIEHSLSKRPSLDRSFYQTDRLTKPEVSGLTTVACIPVKLVFSRLLEKINRPPLKSASNAALLNTGVERKS
ncbi:hypothetical protein SESBI_36801 [Sesbania bispinosa]|nr:hypothetical protein SESBI_36801 [Sesbania bispinosa]